MNALPDSAPTLQSIAEHCGVSHVTVWRALRGGGNVHPKTARLIQEYARKVGYGRDSDARTSVPRVHPERVVRSEAASVLIPYNGKALLNTDNGPLFWEYVAGITEAAKETGTRIQLMEFECQSGGPEMNGADEADRIQQLLHEGVDGLLDFGLAHQTLERLNAAQVPLVSLLTSQAPAARNWATIRADHIRGFYDAWNYLLSMGHRRVGFVGYRETPSSALRRKECLAAAHLIDEALDLMGDTRVDLKGSEGDLREAFLASFGPFDKGKWPTAFFCTNDRLAHLAAGTLRGEGIRVPEDVSLIGFDNTSIAQEGIIPLCTIASPRKEIGATMLHMLENIILGRPGSKKANQILPMQLIKRESVAPQFPEAPPCEDG